MPAALHGRWQPPSTASWLWFVSCRLGAAIPTHGLWHAVPFLSEIHGLIQTPSHSYFYPALETQPCHPHSAWDRGPINPRHRWRLSQQVSFPTALRTTLSLSDSLELRPQSSQFISRHRNQRYSCPSESSEDCSRMAMDTKIQRCWSPLHKNGIIFAYNLYISSYILEIISRWLAIHNTSRQTLEVQF